MDTGGTSEGTRGQPSAGTGGQPHDAVVRRILGQPENAASELRSILPAGLIAHIDIHGLVLQPGSFVDDTLRHRHTDLLFRTTVDGGDAYVYVLIEHQRTPDPLMALRMMVYQTQIWQRHLDDAAAAGEPAPRTLPLIVPIVIYQGDRKWAAPTDVADLLEVDAATRTELGGLLPRVRFELDDLTILDDAELAARPLTPATRITFVGLRRAPGDTDVTRWLVDWTDDLRAVGADSGGRHLVVFWEYVMTVSKTPVERVAEFSATLGPEPEEAVMTTGAQLIAQGIVKGRAEGEARGRAELFLTMLESRFGNLDHTTRERVQTATAAEITGWSTRLVRGVTDLADVFA